MMAKQPLPLKLVPLGLAAVTLSFPIQIMVLYGHSIFEFSAIWAKLTWLNLLIMFFNLTNGWLIFRASTLVVVSTPLLITTVFINNWVVAHSGIDFSMTQTIVASLGFLTLHLPLLTPSCKLVLLNPRQRWWLTAERKAIAIPVAVKPHRGSEFTATTFNLSKTGMFIPFETQVFRESSKDSLLPGKRVTLRLTLDQLWSIRCEGHVVRTALAQGNYPSGIGVQFSAMSYPHRRRLSQFLVAA